MANSSKRVLYGTFNDRENKVKTVKKDSTKRVLYGTISEEENKKTVFQNNLDSIVSKAVNPTVSGLKKQIQAKTVIPSVDYDAGYVKEIQLKKELDKAKTSYENLKKQDDRTLLMKALDTIGGVPTGVSEAKQEYEAKKKEYEDYKATYTEQKIQKQFGVSGAEYIEQLKEKKKNAQTDTQKEVYKKQLESVRKDLYGESNVFQHIGNIVKNGMTQSGKAVAATFDFVLGNPAKWLGFENNVFTQINNDWTNRLEKTNEAATESAKALGDDSNFSVEAGTAVVAAVPDLAFTLLTGPLTTATKLGGTVTNPNTINMIGNAIKETFTSPIFYTSFIREVGVNYEEALESGEANELQASLSALFGATVNARLEMGGWQALPDSIKGKKGFWKKLWNWLKSVGDEGLEEVEQRIASGVTNKSFYDFDKEIFSLDNSDAIINPLEMAKEFSMGTIVGMILGGGTLTINKIADASNENQLKQIGKAVKRGDDVNNVGKNVDDIQDLINYSKSSKNEIIRNIARESNTNNITDSDIGRLYQKAVLDAKEMFDDVYTETDLDNITSEYFGDNIPRIIKDIRSAAFANKLIEMNIEPESNELYNQINNIQNPQLQTYGEGGIINQGGEEDGRIYNQGRMDGSNETGTNTGRESQMGKSNETIDGYVSGGKAEILSGGKGEAPRRIRINHTKNSSVTFTEGAADGTDGYKVYTAFVNAGIKAIYCQGPIERTVNGVTVSRTEAFTAPDGTVYISSKSSLPPKQTFDHEKVHVADKTNNPAYSEYEAVLCDEVDYSSDTYKKVAEKINENQFNNKYDIEDVSTYPIFMREIAAYINQFVLSDPEYAEQTFSGMFSDWGAVVEAVNKFNTDMGADFTESANFMPEGEQGGRERHHTTKAEQDFIKRICDKLGVKMKFIHITPELLLENGYKFENGILPDGFFDKDTNTLYIGFTVVDPVKFIFKHELTHFGEGTEQYSKFVKAVKNSKAYKEWLIEKTGLKPDKNSMAALEGAARRQYIESRKQEKNFGPAKAEAEMIADFVGEYLFNEDGTSLEGLLSSLDHKERNAVIQYILDFLSYLKKKLHGEDNLIFEISRLEDNFNRMLSEAVQTKNTPTENSGDLRFSVASESVIDLSDDSELSKIVEGKHGSERYNLIRNYILRELQDQPVTLRDGKKAVVDKSDALHIANKAADKKTAQISKIKEIIETAQLYAEDKNVEHNKFNYFCYYKANVKYGKETFSIYLNVGKSKNDGSYHIYDITNKLRDSADRINGLERPKPNEGYALTNAVSNNSISKNDSTVNNNYTQESENNSKSNLKFTFARPDNRALVEKAEALEKELKAENKSEKEIRRRIWNKMRLIRDSSGEWVYEILDNKIEVYLDGEQLIRNDPDYEAFMKLENKEKWTTRDAEKYAKLDEKFLRNYPYGTLETYVKHDELFKKYPQLKDYKVDVLDLGSDTKGDFNPKTKTIRINRRLIEDAKRYKEESQTEFDLFFSDLEVKEVFIHEIQHAVQDIENRENGASVEYWTMRLLRGTMPIDPETNKPFTPEKAYELTKGEYEARRSADRLIFGKMTRKEKVPDLGWDKTISTKEFVTAGGSMIPTPTDSEYMSAVESNDTVKLQQMVDSMASAEGYTERLYHQTGADFNEFNTENQKAGKFDWELPTGTFLKPSNDDIGLEGKKQMELYAKIQKPLTFKDRTDAQRFWRKNIPEYKKAADDVIKIDIEYREKVNDATNAARKYLKEWKQNNPDSNSRDIYKDNEYLRLKDIEDSITDEWESKSDKASIEAKKLIDKFISENDYDGIVVEKDQDGINRQTKTYIVFNSNQLKDAAPVTYDDNGDVISLSQRFDSKKGDIRFSVPSVKRNFTEEMNALNQELQNGKISMDEFKSKVDILFKEAGERYGTIKKGETVTGKENFDNPVPKSVNDNTKIRQYTRTILEGGQLTEEMLSVTKQMILSGELSYTPTTNEKNQAAADKIIESGHAEDRWNKIVNCKEMPNSQSITLGEVLLKNAVDRKDAVTTAKLIAEITEVGTRLGQSVQALSLLKRMDGIGQLYYVQKVVNTLNNDLKEKYKKNPVTIVINETLAQQLAESKTKEDFEITYTAILNDIASQVPSTFLDKFNAWRYLAMLANPITHGRNFFGNAVFFPAVKIKDIISCGGEKFIDQSKRTKSIIIKKEYKEFAKNDFLEVEEIITSGGKMNPKRSIADNKPIFKNKVLENIRNFNFDMLEKEDAKFLKLHYQRALGGYLQAKEVNLKTISPKVLQNAREYAILEAQKATFRDASAIANWLANGSQKSLVGNILIEGTLPFKKTSANVLKRSVEYSPIGLITTVGKAIKDFRSGDFTASQFIDGLASNLTGTGIFVLGMWLAASGIIRGGSDGDDEDWFDKMLGKQDYSVEIGGISYTVDWMAPSSVPFFMGVSVMESILAEDNTAVFANVLEGLGVGINPIIELSMLNGVQGALETIRYSEPKELLPNIIINSAESYALQTLPTLGTKFANLIDPVRRSNYIDKTSPIPDSLQSIANKAAGKVPFASKLKAEYINAWGEKENKGNFVTRMFQNFISPGYLSKIDIDNIDTEIKRLAKSTTNMSVFPDTAPKYIKFKNMTKYLKRDEYEIYAVAKGQMSADYIKEAIESEEYKKLKDEQKAEVITNLYAFANAKAKAKLIYSYEELSIMNEGVTEELYKGYSDKVKKAIAEEYFLQKFKTVSNLERNGRSVVSYYCKKAKED